MDARVFRSWNRIADIVQVASGLLSRSSPEWFSLDWVIRTIPDLPSNALDLVTLCVGERAVTRRCCRRPLRALEIVARWRVLSLGAFVSQVRREYALLAMWSWEDRRRRIRRGKYASVGPEDQPVLASEPEADEERPNFYLSTRLTWVDSMGEVMENVD